jgi:lysine 2,3-aminomutase
MVQTELTHTPMDSTVPRTAPDPAEFTPAPGFRVKPTAPASLLDHHDLREGPFWQAIPAYAGVDEATFLDFKWQGKHSITRIDKLLEAIRGVAPAEFIADAEAGFHAAPMSVRVTPYLLSLIDWTDPYADPIRRQFIPLASQMLPDHPELTLDSLGEQHDMPVLGLTHRYPDKALFLALDTCPVYCRFCTRSYAIGLDTDTVDKVHMNADSARWEQIFAYIATRPELEDIVLSGGDVYNLNARNIRYIGERLLNLPNIRRIRYATKGPAVMPQKLLTDHEWRQALVDVVQLGRKLHKDVVLHTHFNTAREITWITRKALDLLHEQGVFVRNQCVLQRGVNDSVEKMQLLVKRLGLINVHPYYVYVHDLVKGTEDLRTSLQTAIDIEKGVRGATAGFNTPTFVVDTLGGGGKRDAHSFEYYDRETGIALYRSPNVDPERLFYFFDPLHALHADVQARWADPVERQRMKDEAERLARAQLAGRQTLPT